MRAPDPARNRRAPLLSALAALLLALGLGVTGLGLAHGVPAAGQAPAPPTAAAVPSAVPPAAGPAGGKQGPPSSAPASSPAPSDPAPSAPAPSAPSQSGPVLPASAPVRLQAPSIGVDTPLIALGRQPDGEVAVPPGAPGSPAGWYTGSVAPGVTGSAIILGHVNAIGTPVGVFYRLHVLASGDQVTVIRADRTAAVFTVDRVDTYHKAAFPTVEVYRNADRPELRLITCGGYDPASGEYLDNTVVYAHLTSSHPA
ncbi:class F sortase [Sinomonas terrae]|uniref:Class F sortase n=1 Tax=Sinomonas terrae TaxID=2908838 RepID=A0ABS9U0B5_9MICC|nr:class F sortase [Sinomonas terrae]MCH6470124.1 class F sortase [Sinomonas terrae]